MEPVAISTAFNPVKMIQMWLKLSGYGFQMTKLDNYSEMIALPFFSDTNLMTN